MIFLVVDKQMKRIERHFPLSHGVPRVDDRGVIGGIIHGLRNGLRCGTRLPTTARP